MAVTATAAVRGAARARMGEMIAVIGPDGPRRTGYVLALADALGGVSAPCAPHGAEAWQELRGVVASGTTVVAACGSVTEAGASAAGGAAGASWASTGPASIAASAPIATEAVKNLLMSCSLS